jgi:hypothetical protein
VYGSAGKGWMRHHRSWHFFDDDSRVLAQTCQARDKLHQRRDAASPQVETLKPGWALVSHTCNSSYSGSKYQEDYSLMPAQALKKLVTKKKKKGAGQVA